MKRKEFLETIGLGAAFVLTSTCLGGCYKDGGIMPAQDVDFTLDLTQSGNSNLQQNGGYIIKDHVVVARNENGEFVAATQTCSHEPRNKVIFRNNEWLCTEHDARFDQNGVGMNNKGSRGLTVYNTELEGNNLRVFI